MQRASMPVPSLNFPAGTMIFNHGSSTAGSNQYTIIHPNQMHNGVAVLQNQSYGQAVPMASIPPGAFRHPPPTAASNPYATGAYAQDIYQQTYGSQQYMASPVFIPGPTYQYAPAPYAQAYSNGGQAYPIQATTGFVGPTAMELQSTPTIAVLPQQQVAPPVSMVGVQSNGSNVGLGTLAVAPQQQSEQSQSASQLPARREKKVLQVIDPDTGEDKMADVLKEKKEHDRVVGIQHHLGGLWKPLVDQQQPVLVQQPSASNLPADATTSVEQGPSRSGSGTPHLEQPKGQSTRSTSRGQSPVFEAPQKGNEAKVQEFYLQFGQQLASSDQPSSEQQSSRQDDPAVLMPPPSAPPPPRSSSSKPESRPSVPRTPPPTPPAVSSQTHPKSSTVTMFEYGGDHSSSSAAAVKKPKDIIGKPEIEFGWLNVSAGDKSLDATDGESNESELPPQQDKGNSIAPPPDYCSTPQKQPPSLDAARDRSPAPDADTGRRSDTAPKSPRDRTYPLHPQSAQVLLNGNSADKFGFAANDVSSGMAAPIGARNASFDQQDSMEEGEIRDMVFEASQPANGNDIRTMTGEEKAAALALLERLKQLEAPDGRKCYSHEFMMAASNLPSSKTRPQFETAKWSKDNIDEVFNLNRQAAQGKMEVRGRPAAAMGAGFAPSWMSGGMPMDVPARRPYPGRVSDTGSMRGDPRGKGSRQGPGQGPGPGRGGNKQPPLVIARPSIDVELKTAENAWKPAHKAESADDPELAETKKLFKEVRGLLNKITPQTFQELSAEFLALEPRMNTSERASGVVDIVFQKAVDEPSFCTTYSDLYDRMTRYQLVQQQQAANSQQQPTKGSVNAANRDTNFRWILLNKCQREFERDKRLETSRQEREAAIDKSETEEQKKKLQNELDEFLTKEKRRTLGNMRFIGELYLKNMLTSKIMHRCVMELIKSEDEESLECICKLLTTIGAKLDVDDKDEMLKAQSEAYYSRLQQLSNGLSSRVRFMIQDLLELRAGSWKPRRKGEGPKTIEQLHQDAAKEKYEQQQELLQEEKKKQEATNQDGRRGGGGGGGGRRDLPNRPSFGAPDHEGRGGRGDRGGGGRDRDQNRQGGRSGAGASNQQQPPQPSADLSKAKAPNLSQHLGAADAEVRLGPSRSTWGKPKGPAGAATTAPKQSDVAPRLSNRFDHLSRSELGGSAPGSRDSSQTRHEDEQENARAARKTSGASTMPKYANEEEVAVDDSGQSSAAPSDSLPSTSAKPSAASSSDMTQEQIKCYSRDLLDELVDANSFIDALKLLDDKVTHIERILWYAMDYVTEKSEKHRPAAIRVFGPLIAHSFSSERLKAGVISGLSSFVRYVVEDDVASDVPKIWTYIGQVLGSALSTSDPVQDFDLSEFASIFREAGEKELLAQTMLAISNKDKAISKWHSVIDHISELGFDDLAAIESLFRRRDLDFLLRAPSAVDASSDVSESVHGTGQSTTTIPSLPSSISSTATVSAGASGPSDGSSAASKAFGSAELDPVLVEMERFVKMEDTIDVDGLIDFVDKSGRLKDDDERSLNFLGALVKSLCSKLIVAGDNEDSVDIDTEEFKRCSKVLLRFATQRPELEMKALNTLGDIFRSKGCPKGLLVKMLSTLHESNVIPTETLQEWWQSSENLTGMLRASGELKAFFSQFASETGSDGGSDSDQGE